ncbi:hypothetical protein O1R50_03415 [Glycomyces luteolus]|uniref:Uncharacterized protein n=1 Tax=Glycomyces luteolus TaxID=2670330 RepID=A0A9X3PA12_9ACTN|nr:hypothetical protein [Glycomyces luteolus]MDA1358654.1 hypothetical protein [Glycomyces luteolus]
MTSTRIVSVTDPDTAPAHEIADLATYLETVEFRGSTQPPTVSATMSLTGRLTRFSLPEAVFEQEQEIAEKAATLLEQMRQTAQRTTLRLIREQRAAR